MVVASEYSEVVSLGLKGPARKPCCLDFHGLLPSVVQTCVIVGRSLCWSVGLLLVCLFVCLFVHLFVCVPVCWLVGWLAGWLV